MAEGQSLLLSAAELRTLTKWPDSVIIEFLSLQSSVAEITQNISIVINQIDQVITQEAHTETVVVGVQREQAVLLDQLVALDALPSKVASLKRDLANLLTANTELDATLLSLTAKVAINKRDQLRLIDALQEQFTTLQAQNGQLRARITLQGDKLVDLQQELAGS